MQHISTKHAIQDLEITMCSIPVFLRRILGHVLQHICVTSRPVKDTSIPPTWLRGLFQTKISQTPQTAKYDTFKVCQTFPRKVGCPHHFPNCGPVMSVHKKVAKVDCEIIQVCHGKHTQPHELFLCFNKGEVDLVWLFLVVTVPVDSSVSSFLLLVQGLFRHFHFECMQTYFIWSV